VRDQTPERVESITGSLAWRLSLQFAARWGGADRHWLAPNRSRMGLGRNRKLFAGRSGFLGVMELE
jgi:hypothetical protein